MKNRTTTLSGAGYLGDLRKARTSPPICPHRCDASWSGHWREFHRGHGCDLDPSQVKP